jgi:hypothetical protein
MFVVHFYRLDFGGDNSRSEGSDHSGLDDDAFLDTTNRECSNTSNLGAS